MILSDGDLTKRIVQNKDLNEARQWWKDGNWDKVGDHILIDPFEPNVLGPCCYDLSVGGEYVSLRDPFNCKKLSKGEHITIGPSETVLILTKEYVCLPRNILAMVIPRATWIFEGISLSATRIDPTWYGKLLVGVTNMAKTPVALDYDEKFCTSYFMMVSTQICKPLSPQIQRALGRETIGTIRFVHAKQQKLLLPDNVSREDIEKVVDLYGWPWDVVRGMFDLTRKETIEWINKEIAADIIGAAVSQAEKRAFDRLDAQAKEQAKWTKNLIIAVITVLGTIGAAVLGVAVTYIFRQLTSPHP